MRSWYSPYGRARPGRAPGIACLIHRAHTVDDLLGRLCLNAGATLGAVRHACTGVKQTQVVVDLRDRADGRARVARGRLLVDGDGRREAFDEVHVGLVHLAQELTGVGGQGLDVATLPFGEDRVEGEGGLTGSRQTGEDDHGVAGQLQVHVLEVVFAGTLDD